MINRSAVSVSRKQPFWDWADQLDDADPRAAEDQESTVYLLPSYDDDVEAMEQLSKVWDVIFQEELAGWHLIEEDWPSNRTFAMFRKWFDFEFHSVVEDLCDFPLEDDDF